MQHLHEEKSSSLEHQHGLAYEASVSAPFRIFLMALAPSFVQYLDWKRLLCRLQHGRCFIVLKHQYGDRNNVKTPYSSVSGVEKDT